MEFNGGKRLMSNSDDMANTINSVFHVLIIRGLEINWEQRDGFSPISSPSLMYMDFYK